MFPEWPRPAPWSRHLVPFKLSEEEDDHRIVVKQTRFRLVETARQRAAGLTSDVSGTRTKRVWNVCLSFSLSLLLFLRRLVVYPTRTYNTRRPFLVSLSCSSGTKHTPLKKEGWYATLRPRDSNRYGSLSFLYRAVISRQWTLRH